MNWNASGPRTTFTSPHSETTFGHFGMEWDVREVQGPEREELKRFIGIYKEHRGLIHSGRMVRADVPGDSLMLHGVVAAGPAMSGDTAALFAFIRTRTGSDERPGRIAIPGLEPERSYRVEPIFPSHADADYAHTFTQVRPPEWLTPGAEATGRFLAEVGLPMPILNPEHALLLSVSAV